MNIKKVAIIIFSVFFIFLIIGNPIFTKDQLVSDKNRLKPDHAPTPFSAQEIHDGCPNGRIIKYLLEVPNQPETYSIMTFLNGDKNGTNYESSNSDLKGEMIGKKQQTYAKWSELQAHASFLKEQTTISQIRINTPAGEFECLLYTVKSAKGLQKLWFAKNLPGPPIKFEGFKENKLIYKMTLIENKLAHED